MTEEFVLSEKREEMFEAILSLSPKSESNTIVLIKINIEQQDKEFIRRLKEKINHECKMCKEYPTVIDLINKLAGNKLTKSQEELDYEKECEEGKI